MAFKSLAQKEKLRELVREGKFPQAKFDEFEEKSKNLKLPPRIPNQKSLKIGVVKNLKVIK